MKVLEIQGTPNPDAMKFLLDGGLVAAGAKSFEDTKAGEKDPLASAIFAIGPIASVFYMDRFVTVTKHPNVDWNELTPKVTEVIEANTNGASASDDEGLNKINHMVNEGGLVSPVETEVAKETPTSDNTMLEKINQLLDENVRPALAGDGGGLEVLGYQDFVLSVHYQGACGSCPSSTAGTLTAIQNLLQRMIDPRIEVASV